MKEAYKKSCANCSHCRRDGKTGIGYCNNGRSWKYLRAFFDFFAFPIPCDKWEGKEGLEWKIL